jgi:hypothetical protein
MRVKLYITLDNQQQPKRESPEVKEKRLIISLCKYRERKKENILSWKRKRNEKQVEKS